MNKTIKKLDGANMDIDLATPAGVIAWEQDKCPWNEAEKTRSTPMERSFFMWPPPPRTAAFPGWR